MRAPLALAAVVLAATTLSACGGGSDGSSAGGDEKTYCADLKKDAAYFNGLSGGDGSDIQSAIDRFHDLANEAPSAVSSDWKVIDGAFTQLESGLKSAGLTVEQFGQIQKTGKLPDGVDAAKVQSVVAKLQGLSNTKFQKAGSDIEKHAKSVCKVNLSSS